MRQAVERFLLQSTPASRCLLITGVTTPAFAVYLLVHAYGLSQDEIRRGLRVPVMLGLQAALLVGTVVLSALTLWLWPRRRDRQALPGAEIIIALVVGGIYTLLAILSGLFTASANLILMGVLVIGLMLLQRRTMLVAFVVSLVILMSYDILVALHQVPYGPAINEHAFRDGQAVWWWARWRSLALYIGWGILLVLVLALFESLDSLHRHLAHLSSTDVLTGLPNRRSFMDRLQTELARQKRTGRPLSLVLIDADHFKRINDEHGHLMGDEVLKRLASVLNLGVRTPTDMAARLGGEEFALLLPDARREDAEAVCYRIQKSLAQYRFGGAGGEPLGITVSMGVVQSRGQGVEALLRAADANLYQAKREGRDRFVTSVLEDAAS